MGSASNLQIPLYFLLQINNLNFHLHTVKYIHLVIGKVEVKDNTTAITVSVILVITIIVTIIIILFVLNFTRKKHCQPKRQNLIDHEVNTEPDGPLEFDGEDEKMYEQKKALGCQRLVPTRVEQFEAMASGTVNAPEPEDMVNDEYDQAQNLITRID